RNMFAQDGHFNMVPYRVMENEWSDFARYGARVEVEITLGADRVGERPSLVAVTGHAYSANSGRLLRQVEFDKFFRNGSLQSYQRKYFKKQIVNMVEAADRGR
ncbi:hypothetical protein ACPXB3_22430, partial [Gordonia sp. DT219]|uniref:hypothetical protein n=1 Tax=Gordonia sp. DT219 TaxID=3416658 RepID=UPI003CEA8097